MSYILKQQPEDFIVTEISNVKILESGKHIYFLVKKRKRNTVDVVREIAKQLGIKEKEVGFAGSKDKNAVTEQVCSARTNKLSKLNVDQTEIKFLGYGDKPISLGDLVGNKFEIVVRHLGDFKINKTDFVANYFDEQRFSLHNVDIGRHLVRKEFREAARLINDSRCQKHLETNKHDYIGAMRKIPIRLLRMYVHAYQSYIWNEVLAKYLKVGKRVTYSLGEFIFVKEKMDLQIPLIGFASGELKLDPQIKKIIEQIMHHEELDYHDFVIKQIPELTLEGALRDAFVEVKDLKVGKVEKDELNVGKKKIKILFSLGKGSYATIVIKKILNLT